MKYHFKTHKEENGFWGECIELEGCYSEGDTVEELKINLEEALNLYLDEPAGSFTTFSLPDETYEQDDEIISIPVDPEVAFALLIRQERIKHKMTQIEVMHAMGLKNRNSYARLESRSNPSLTLLKKVMKVFPEFPIKECLS